MLHHFKLIVGASVLFVLFALYKIRDRDQTIAALRQYAPLTDYLQRFDDVEDVKTEHVLRKRKIRVGNAAVQKMINDIMEDDADFFPEWYWTATFATLVKTLGNGRRRYPGDYVLQSPSERQKSDSEGWGPMDRHIRQYSLYHPGDPAVKDLLHRMAILRLETTKANRKGYKITVIHVKFQDGGKAWLKPMMLPRDEAAGSRFERHYAEIAAFHLDRLMGYYRVPPTVGRFINLRTELYPLLPDKLRNRFFIDKDGRTCFYGFCRYCYTRPYCGAPETTEVSLMYNLPAIGERRDMRNPLWRGITISRRPQAYLCNKTRTTFAKGDILLLELSDVSYFDSLIDNKDRHHYAMYGIFNNNTIPLLYDNSKGFRNATDDKVMRALFRQDQHCCIIKKSTFLKYLMLFMGPFHLSDLMRASLREDPVSPVLLEDQLQALDRRVNKTLLFIRDCLEGARRIDDVIIDDTV